MGSSVVQLGPGLVVALVALLALGVVVGRSSGLGQERPVLRACLRAAAQLAVVSSLIVVVVGSLWASAAFAVLMLCVAAATSAGRVTGGPARGRGAARRALRLAAPLAAGVLPVLALVLASGAVPLRGEAVVPVAGIVIGGAMAATSLAGRRMLDELEQRHGEVEAALALGFLPRDAALLVARPVAATALVPALDQTRTVGLVTLPGAYVGVLLGGGSALQAGAAQLLVLVGLLAAEVIAVWVVTEQVTRGAVRRCGTTP
ncbi:putative ABC transport system permease protein [Klenkia soli]|uniref:Putative ABC transport system permease protein n=1 Tax=Klenkia soli TaxID=1052260 RepID=A0A1H0CFS4_9ACTN|nr:ABC transporter permease [Klenkia soli]SDN56748.1 putative ABC transport system permease protein [Klenkia soli]